VSSTSLTAVTARELRDHWVWRPEWTPERTCLYWYLTFRPEEITTAIGKGAFQLVRRVSWLDPVPVQWCHVTVADVGFTDELQPSDRDDVTAAVADSLRGEDRLPLTLGPLLTFSSAVVLATGPLARLRSVKDRVRRATSAVLGPRHVDFHRHLYWPHVSLGYANRAVDADTVARFREHAPEVGMAGVNVDALTLAAVTRRDRGYRWEVEAQVDLLGDAARSSR
jgi:2'-5' RNA ligase